MIVIVGANGVTAFIIRSLKGYGRRVVCLNDGRTMTFPDFEVGTNRAVLTGMMAHAESINGSTLSVGVLAELA
jgi:hypothetical protein